MKKIKYALSAEANSVSRWWNANTFPVIIVILWLKIPAGNLKDPAGADSNIEAKHTDQESLWIHIQTCVKVFISSISIWAYFRHRFWSTEERWWSTFTQVHFLMAKSRYWNFRFYATLYFYSATSQRGEIVLFTPLHLSDGFSC